MGPIVFVGHDAQRTGPPIYLLHLLEWIRHHHPDVPVEVLLLRGGPLVHRFRALAPTTVVDWYDRGDDLVGLAQVSHHPGRHRWLHHRIAQVATLRTRWRLRRIRPALLYFNCASTIKVWPGLPWTRCPRIAHVHELEVGLVRELTEAQRLRFLRADRVLVVSHPVRELVERQGVADDRIGWHPGMVSAPEHLHGHDDGPLTVGMCGTVDWRKGYDLFVRLAWLVRRSAADLDVRFRWVGGGPGSLAAAQEMDARVQPPAEVEWVGEVDDATTWIQGFDVLALTAREDAFPLVCLEAAAAGVPFVCFDTGGASDLAAEGAGASTPYPDLQAMADEVADLCRSAARRDEVGRRGASHVASHHSVDVLAPRVWSEIEDLLR